MGKTITRLLHIILARWRERFTRCRETAGFVILVLLSMSLLFPESGDLVTTRWGDTFSPIACRRLVSRMFSFHYKRVDFSLDNLHRGLNFGRAPSLLSSTWRILKVCGVSGEFREDGLTKCHTLMNSELVLAPQMGAKCYLFNIAQCNKISK